ncbi:MAG: helicase-exonuclease AddAB subunit AddA [Eubacterium sp.]|nr:helicase-exonuclease AddAB subunit AddA [Eubacterium sp.]
MGVTWTKEQQQVIALRNRNLLVSAAAGSGKTAVLVERIVQKVLDGQHPVDIDRMLIVTFTKAAAAEMRERVSQAIEKRLDAQPDDSRLQRQATLVHNAQITTIDSFCLYVVRNYFQTIGLEPSFRIADPGELELLKADVAREVMERHYEKKEEGFLRLADCYATAKSDDALVDFMLRLYDFSQSYPWPVEWLSSLPDAYRDAGELDGQAWMQGLLRYLGFLMADLKRQMEYAARLCSEHDGPQMYLAAVEDDLARLEGLCSCSSYEAYSKCLLQLSFQKLGVNRKYEGSKEKQEQVKSIRNTVKDALIKVQDSYFYQDLQKMQSDIEKILPDVKALAALAQSFAKAYAEKKEERKLLDFSDIEHFALNILVDEKTKEPTAAARELREMFEEIMIDEYQDSNYVQETILKAVSREGLGEYNIFMVGDVKQSIYRFRLARPELFMEKYHTYTSEESSRQKIDLHKNFRSRTQVIESINQVFYKIMHRDLGNVEYDQQAALYPGAAYPECKEAGMFQSELLLALASQEELAEAGCKNAQEMEARMAAARIRELMEAQLVTDRDSGTLRKVRYRDIVILLRSITGWADTFLKVLTEAGIPAHTSTQSGYFAAVEIQTILSMLSILDNPLQDIPAAAVLASPIVGMSGEELARIRAASKEHFYFLALEEYAQYGDGSLREKAASFLELYRRLRRLTSFTPIHKLIRIVLEETGYASYIQAMPAGSKRLANLDMLLEKAVAYEKTSYKGLFHFVRYIEKLKKYEIDFGEADITSENEDVVRIMSIHKSKGLEFPVVFVCGMGKQFNKQDIRSRMILHPEYGIGLDYIDTEKRIRKSGFIKKILENEIGIENQGEELRVLYVALTRAKEKLIMTGAVKEDPGSSQAAQQPGVSDSSPMRYFSRYHAASYLDWVYPCAAGNTLLYAIRLYRAGDLALQEAVEAAVLRLDEAQVKKLYQTADKALYEKLDAKLSWSYPYASDTDLKTKISVTELKRRQAMVLEEDTPAQEEWFAKERESLVPAFLRTQAEQENYGAMRGSAVHKVMEEVDFVRSANSGDRTADIRMQMEHMLAEGRITEEMKELVHPRMLGRFLDSPLAARMAQAQERGELYKEQPFVMGIPASQVYEAGSGELVLIQGIVDVYWVEGGELVILDYKTDAVTKEEQLTKRYQAQLDLYGEALQKATGKKVKEKIIYSFSLHKPVELGCETA